MFVFGMDIPIAETLFVIMVLQLVLIILLFIQLGRLTQHVKVLERTTFQIRKYEKTPKKKQ